MNISLFLLLRKATALTIQWKDAQEAGDLAIWGIDLNKPANRSSKEQAVLERNGRGIEAKSGSGCVLIRSGYLLGLNLRCQDRKIRSERKTAAEKLVI